MMGLWMVTSICSLDGYEIIRMLFMSNTTRPGYKEMQPHRSLCQHHNVSCIKLRFSRAK